MRTHATRRTVRALAAGAAVASLGLAGLVVSAPASAQPDSCGAHVVYGKWKRYPTGFQKHRTWTWYYYNCSSSKVHRKVIVWHGNDSTCFTIKHGGEVRFSDEELNFPPARQYDGTKSC